jgi:hypothetical protein
MSAEWIFLACCVGIILLTILATRYGIRQIDKGKKGW